jgi:transmembrane sensor
MAEKTNITNEDFYFEMIAKELNGEISEKEKSLLHEWVNKAEGNRAIYEQSIKNWKNTAVKNEIPDFDMEDAWLKVKAGTRISSNQKEGKVVSFRRQFISYKMVATILLLVGIFAFLKYTVFNAPEALNYTTLENEIKIYLPDSSEVLLNKNSRLTYYTDYNSEKRRVFLEGEAFFDVRKSPDKKFEVVGLRSITTVLGTSFSVRSVRNETKEVVQVVTGRVSFADNLSKEKYELILTPGFKGELDEAFLNTNRMIKTEIKDPNFIAWKNKRLIFENTGMAEIKETLEKYFSKKIEVNDPLLLDCRFTGTFDQPKLEEIMEVLALSTNFSYTITKDKIILTGKGCTKK